MDYTQIPENFEIHVDDGQFGRQVINQAMTNVIKHAFDENHKKVTIKFTVYPDHESGNITYDRIEISDDGKGVPGLDKPEILLERFNITGENKLPSFGLFELYRVITKHEGKIFLETDEGFVITILLPQKTKIEGGNDD